MSEKLSKQELRVPKEFFEYDPNATGSKALIRLKSGLFLFYTRDTVTIHYPEHLDLLGGHIDNDDVTDNTPMEDRETPFGALAREIAEEAGLTIEASNVKYTDHWPSEKYPNSHAWLSYAELDQGFEDVVWGPEGRDPEELPLQSFLGSDKAYPVLRDRAELIAQRLNL